MDGVCNEGSARRPPMRQFIEILNRSLVEPTVKEEGKKW